MSIHLPRIEGTAYDHTLNELIDSVNRQVDPVQAKLAAHVVCAVLRFLIENREVEAGTRWSEKVAPLVKHITIIDPMVDKIYESLVQRAKQVPNSGCGGVAAILIAITIAVGLAWWITA